MHTYSPPAAQTVAVELRAHARSGDAKRATMASNLSSLRLRLKDRRMLSSHAVSKTLLYLKLAGELISSVRANLDVDVRDWRWVIIHSVYVLIFDVLKDVGATVLSARDDTSIKEHQSDTKLLGAEHTPS